MKKQILHILTVVSLLFLTNVNYGQGPVMGTVANFALFTSDGAVTNSGISQVTGNVGSNSGAGTGFGNVNGVMHSQDSATAQCAKDLLVLYNYLDSAKAGYFPSSTIGNGDTLIAGVYSVKSATTLNGNLYLDAKGNGNALFIFQIKGSFSTKAASRIILLNGAKACNVFWKTEGLVSMAAGTNMKGNIVANNAAINMNTGDTLEGRALSTTGAITIDGVMAYTPIGCGSPTLTGPAAPNLRSAECYELFSSDGAVTNSGITNVVGDVGTNVGLTTGYNAKLVKGTIHLKPDSSTKQCAADLTLAYNYLDSLKYDIQLLYPAQFGKNLVLTPHTYLLDAATVFTDSLYLNAEGDTNAVFVMKINGAFSTSTYSTVILTNGAQSKNVYWMIQGAVSINNYSIFRGTIVCNGGALGALNTGVLLDGRALTTGGALTTTAMKATMTAGCSSISTGVLTGPDSQIVCLGGTATFSVTTSGSGLKYQWRKGTKNLTNGGNIAGATSDTLTISNVAASNADTSYNVIVSGSNGPNDTSSNASLIVNKVLAITKAPTDVIACAGSSVGFTVTATGTGLKYQWRKGNVKLVNGGNVAGATSDMLTINNIKASDTASDYNVITSGGCSVNDTSINVSLSMNIAPAITKMPGNQTVCPGSDATFSVTASGTGLVYVWRKGLVILTNGNGISGVNSSTLTIKSVGASDAATNYNVLVTGGCSLKDSSKNVSLAINIAPGITTGPANQVVKTGSSASFTVVATGTGITYQWMKGSVALTNGGNISGATSAKLTINPVALSDAAKNYKVVIGGTCSPDSTSGNATLTVNDATGIAGYDAGNTNNAVTIYPNPFSTSVTITINDATQIKNCELWIYNTSGKVVINTTIVDQATTLNANTLIAGVYFYKVIGNGQLIQSGKLVSINK